MLNGLSQSGGHAGQTGTQDALGGGAKPAAYRDFAHLAAVAKAFVATQQATIAKNAEEVGVGQAIDVKA